MYHPQSANNVDGVRISISAWLKTGIPFGAKIALRRHGTPEIVVGPFYPVIGSGYVN